MPPPPPPIYKGPALKTIHVEVKRDKSQELYCAAEFEIDRGDSAGEKTVWYLGGQSGRTQADVPAGWTTVYVQVNAPRILASPGQEPAIASPPSPWTAGPISAKKTNDEATVVFNFVSQKATAEIEVSQAEIDKVTAQEQTNGGTGNFLELGGEILNALAATIPGIGDARRVWQFTTTTVQSSRFQVTVQYVDFSAPPEVWVNGVKQ